MVDPDRAFVFLVHRTHGLLLLYTTRKKSKGPHYQIPGGHVEKEDFDAAEKSNTKSGDDDPILAYKICAARELYEETGIDLRGQGIQRLQPAQLRAPREDEKKMSCEYKKRIFFTAEIFDKDVALEHSRFVSASSLSQPLDKIPPTAMLKLSEEHQGFRFERNLSAATESLKLHSGGKVSTALSMAVENGDVIRLLGKDNEDIVKGEQVQSQVDCNTIITRELEIPSCRETNPNDCHRIYHLYFPQIVCENDKSLDQIGTLPLVFAVHCYGCNSQVVMESFNHYANSHNAIIVGPEGIQRSFNGLDCCGYALSSKIDDVGFFRQIQESLEDEYSFVQSSYSYAVGWSNGGFMVMYSAQLFRAIAPISGYIIDYPDIRGGTGIFFHHSLDDPFVRSTGCCNDPDMPACCCGIFADRCMSVQDVMNDIAQKKNGCDYELGSVQLEQSFDDASRGISCMTATGESCIANNTICLYEHSGHFNGHSFADSFPMSEQVVDFFATDACNINDGIWNNEDKECLCREKSKFGGTYCLDPIAGDAPSSNESPSRLHKKKTVSSSTELSNKKSNHFFTGGALALTVAAMCYVKHRLNRVKQKDKNEQSMESEEKIELVASDARGLVRM